MAHGCRRAASAREGACGTGGGPRHSGWSLTLRSSSATRARSRRRCRLLSPMLSVTGSSTWLVRRCTMAGSRIVSCISAFTLWQISADVPFGAQDAIPELGFEARQPGFPHGATDRTLHRARGGRGIDGLSARPGGWRHHRPADRHLRRQFPLTLLPFAAAGRGDRGGAEPVSRGRGRGRGRPTPNCHASLPDSVRWPPCATAAARDCEFRPWRRSAPSRSSRSPSCRSPRCGSGRLRASGRINIPRCGPPRR